MLPDYYASIANASIHPLRIAYDRFESEKKNALATMQANESMYQLYVQAENKLNRLKEEQKLLLSIMPVDISGDLIIDKLK